MADSNGEYQTVSDEDPMRTAFRRFAGIIDLPAYHRETVCVRAGAPATCARATGGLTQRESDVCWAGTMVGAT